MQEIFEFDLASILISGIYFFAVIVLLTLLLSYQRKVRISSALALIWAVSIYYFFFLLNHWIPFKSIPPDSIFYANIIKDFWTYYDSWSASVKLYALINYLPIHFSLRYPVVFVLINIFFFYCGVILVGKSFLRWMRSKHMETSKNFMSHLLIYSSLYPAGLIIIPTLLREGTMIFFLGLAIYQLTALDTGASKNRALAYAVLSTSVLALILIRPIGGISLVLALFFIFLIRQFGKGLLKGLAFAFLPSILVLFLLHAVAEAFYDISFSFSWLEAYRSSHKELFGPEAYGTALPWTGSWQVLRSSLLLLIQYIAAPLPVMIPTAVTFQKIIPALDAIFILFGISTVLAYARGKEFRTLFLLVLLMLWIPALFETHISGAYRHRMNAIILLLPLFAYSTHRLVNSMLTKTLRHEGKD